MSIGRLAPLLTTACVVAALLWSWLFRLPDGAERFPAPAWHARNVPAVARQVDAAFRDEWRRQGSRPAGRASDLTIARRLALALAGTVPSLEEIRRLEALPPATRTATWVEYLLRDRRTAGYLAERFARSLVGNDDGPFLLYRRRRLVRWLAEEIHRNRPYDAIVRDLIAASGLWTSSPGTNFLTATITDDQHRPDENTLTVRVCRSLLGVRLDCAQCHDHPFDPRWAQDDFASLASFFARAEVSLAGIRDAAEADLAGNDIDVDDGGAPARVPFARELLPAEGGPRHRLARWVTHPSNKMFARATVNRMWKLLFGRALVEPLDDLPLDGPFPTALEVLAEDFARNGFDLRQLVRTMAATQVFQQSSAPVPGDRDADGSQNWTSFPLTRLRPEQIAGALIQAASLTTIDADSHILVRLARHQQQQAFVRRYGDRGFNEMAPATGTLPQRLLMLNGDLVREKTRADLVHSACARIAAVAPDNATAVHVAYLCVLTRAPTIQESSHFQARLRATQPSRRKQVMSDLYWALLNAAEFSWNH